MLYYINKYRKEECTHTVAEKDIVSKYCKIRSEQLKNRFSYNEDDIHKAATQLKYGVYIDPKKDFDIDGEPYYQPTCNEAIATCPEVSSVDKTAKAIVDTIKNTDYWNCIGGADDFYNSWYNIGVGCHYSDGIWYACVALEVPI